MILTRRLRITFKPETKLIISKQRVPSSVPLLLTEEAPLLVFCPCYALCLGHLEFKTLLTLSSAFSKRPKFLYQTIQLVVCAKSAQARFFGTKKFLHSANLQAAISTAGFLQVPPKSSFKKLLLGTRLWQHAKMSTSLKSPDRFKDAEWERGQLSHRLPIPYVPVVDIVTPKEEPQIFKIKLPDTSHLSMPIYSRGNNEEYLAHIVAVLQVIKWKGLPKKCRVLAKVVVRWSEALKNLQEAAESQDTVSTTVVVTARKVEIEQTQQMLQEAQNAHDKAITKLYKQLRNLLSGNAQSQWDCICCKMHKRDLWAAVNGQVTEGRRPRMWTSFLNYLELHKLTVFSARLRIPIFGSNFGDPHRKRNYGSVFGSKDSVWIYFLKFQCLESQKIGIPICKIRNPGNLSVQELSMYYHC